MHNSGALSQTITQLPVVTSSYCTGLHHSKSPSTFHTYCQYHFPFPAARITSKKPWDVEKTSCLSVWACERYGEKGFPPLALGLCCTFTGLSGMSSWMHTLATLPVSQHIQCHVVMTQECKGFFICGVMPGIAYSLSSQLATLWQTSQLDIASQEYESSSWII